MEAAPDTPSLRDTAQCSPQALPHDSSTPQMLQTKRSVIRQTQLSLFLSVCSITKSTKPILPVEVIPKLQSHLSSCGKTSTVLTCPECGDSIKKVISNKCYIKICNKKPCVHARQSRTYKRYAPLVKQMKNPRFITLTYAGHHALTFEAEHNLRSCLHLLLQHLRRKNKIESYVCALEVVKHPDGYFMHLHLIYDGQFIPFDLLQALWKKYTKTAHRVRIERVRSRIHALHYLTEYITKGSMLSDLSIWEYLPILRMRFFNSWSRHKILIIREVWEAMYCPICMSRLRYNRALSLEASGIPPPCPFNQSPAQKLQTSRHLTNEQALIVWNGGEVNIPFETKFS